MKTNDEKMVRASSLAVSKSHLDVTLEDGRMLRIPTKLFPALKDASIEKLLRWEWIGEGIGIGWPDLDEHLSIAGFLRHTPYFVERTNGVKPRQIRQVRASSRKAALHT
jgi:Protein of unknown function (DUF2442)